MLEQAGGLFGVHEGFVHADGHGQRMLERRESGERVSQSPLAPGGGQVQWLFDPADIQLVVGAQLGQVVQAEALVRVQGDKQMRERPTHRAYRRKPPTGSHLQLNALVARVHALAHFGHRLGGRAQAHHRAAVHLARRPASIPGVRQSHSGVVSLEGRSDPVHTVELLAEQLPQGFFRNLAVQVPAGHLQSAHRHGERLRTFQREQVGRHLARVQVRAGDDPGRQHVAQHAQIVAEGLGQIPISVEGRAFPQPYAALAIDHLDNHRVAVGQRLLRRFEGLGKRQAP